MPAAMKKVTKKPSAFKLSKKSNKVGIMKVKKQVHPEMAISYKTMCMLNSILNEQWEGLWDMAKDLAQKNGRKVITGNDMTTAVKLQFKGELVKHAVSEGEKAWNKYTSA